VQRSGAVKRCAGMRRRGSAARREQAGGTGRLSDGAARASLTQPQSCNCRRRCLSVVPTFPTAVSVAPTLHWPQCVAARRYSLKRAIAPGLLGAKDVIMVCGHARRSSHSAFTTDSGVTCHARTRGMNGGRVSPPPPPPPQCAAAERRRRRCCDQLLERKRCESVVIVCAALAWAASDSQSSPFYGAEPEPLFWAVARSLE